MKKLFAFVMLFSFVLAFSPPNEVVNVNVSDDICAVGQNQDINIIADCDVIAEFNFELINEAEVEISPGLNQEVTATNATREQSANLIIGRLMNNNNDGSCFYGYEQGLKTEATDKFTLNHKLYETNTGYITAQNVLT